MDYEWFIKREHINSPLEIFTELEEYFKIDTIRFFPINIIPLKFCNLCIGINLTKK